MADIIKPFGYVRDNSGGPMVFQHEPFDDTTRLVCSTETVYSYAQLQAAVKHEREACAKVCEDMGGTMSMFANVKDARMHNNAIAGCAVAIRARMDA